MNDATVTQLVPRPSLTASTARQLTDSIKKDAEALFERLLNAYERGVHVALGYSSWSAYCKTEFNMSKARAYQLIEAGRVARAIKTQSKNLDSPPRTDAVARKLTPIRKQKGDEAVAEAWAEIVEQHGPEPTAEEVEEVVRTMSDPEPTRKLTRDQEKFANNLSAMALCADYINETLGSRGHAITRDSQTATKRLIDLDAETLALWRSHIRAINAASLRLRRHVGLPARGETP